MLEERNLNGTAQRIARVVLAFAHDELAAAEACDEDKLALRAYPRVITLYYDSTDKLAAWHACDIIDSDKHTYAQLNVQAVRGQRIPVVGNNDVSFDTGGLTKIRLYWNRYKHSYVR